MNMEDLASQEISDTNKEEAPSDEISKNANKSVEEKVEKEKDETCWHLGECKWFNSSKGWGFINTIEHALESKEVDKNMPTGDIFVHQAVIEKKGFRSLGMGEEVEFKAMRSDKGWEAVRVRGVDGKEILGMVREERKQKKIRQGDLHFDHFCITIHIFHISDVLTVAQCPPTLQQTVHAHHCLRGVTTARYGFVF